MRDNEDQRCLKPLMENRRIKTSQTNVVVNVARHFMNFSRNYIYEAVV